jgi:hypothetical protein
MSYFVNYLDELRHFGVVLLQVLDVLSLLRRRALLGDLMR